MKFEIIYWVDLTVKATINTFIPEKGVKECHLMLESIDPAVIVSGQFENLNIAAMRLLEMLSLQNFSLAWKRYFLSDAFNQYSFVQNYGNEAVSAIQQPPMNGTKAALWLYFIESVSVLYEKNEMGKNVIVSRPFYNHLFCTQLHERTGDCAFQTNRIFDQYQQFLPADNCNLRNNCIRTWIYIQNIDNQYKGMAVARKAYFEKAGMTPETHFIASTGIEGRYAHPEVLVLMDAYAVQGIREEQIRFLHAPEHMNPTHEYGVTFERGTSIDYGNRRHIFISGTASINNKGETVHLTDIKLQLERTLENIRALLAEADTTMEDVAYLIVYLRDTADHEIVRKYMEAHYPATPQLFTLAPVCRPEWLVEIECMAIKEVQNKEFPIF